MAAPDPLQSARIRHRRADKHLTYIRKALRRLNAVYADGVPTYVQPFTRDYVFKEPLKRPSTEIVLRCGELLYNLRAALDHFTYALAIAHSGIINDRAQFPIETTCEGFKGRRDTYLKGIRNESIAFFESYQPYKGCHWTLRFRNLSNHDKHRDLRWMISAFDPDTRALDQRLISDAPARRPAFDFRAFQPDAFDTGAVDVNLKGTLDVTFAEGGLDVVQALNESVTEVGLLIDRGASEFLPLR